MPVARSQHAWQRCSTTHCDITSAYWVRADCCAAATYLAEQGLVDCKRMVIAGGSAGGFTTLACLAFR